MRFDSIADVINKTVDDLHSVFLLIAFVIIIISIVRNYQQLGDCFGLKYLIVLGFVILLMLWFPKMSTALLLGTKNWGTEESKQVVERMDILMGFKLEEGGWVESLKAMGPWLFFKGAAIIGKFVREVFLVFLGGAFIVLRTLSPIFIAMLAVPETKSIGVNMLMITVAIILSPITIVFGDLLLLWCADSMWITSGAGTAIAAGAVGKVTLSALAAGATVPTVAVGSAIAFGAFGGAYLLLIIVAYIGVPWAIMSLFRGGGIGNPLAMTLNTASNVLTMSKMGAGGGSGAQNGMKGVIMALKNTASAVKNATQRFKK